MSTESDLRTSFADYKKDAHNWITLATGEFYPDILKDACLLYGPVLELFGQLVRTSESSERLFMQIVGIREGLDADSTRASIQAIC
jgi:hypothetical protein